MYVSAKKAAQIRRSNDRLQTADRAAVMECVRATGIAWVDRRIEADGDYKRLAFLGFSDLAFTLYCDPSSYLAGYVTGRAEWYQSRRGQTVEVSSCGQTITLGYGLRKES